MFLLLLVLVFIIILCILTVVFLSVHVKRQLSSLQYPFKEFQKHRQNHNATNYTTTKKQGKRCIIIGGSFGGLLTAKTVSPHFNEVYVFEQNQYQENKSVVQHGNQTHVFFNRVSIVLECLFPGLTQLLKEKNGFFSNFNQTIIYFGGNEPVDLNKKDLDYEAFGVSRNFLEYHMRSMLKKENHNITFFENSKVIDLIWKNQDNDNNKNNEKQVIGVKIEEEGKQISADLVIDCGGVNSSTIHWLNKQLNLTIPISKVSVPLNYLTCVYKLKDPKKPFRKVNENEKWYIARMSKIPIHAGVGMYRIEEDKAFFTAYELGKNCEFSKIKSNEALKEYLREKKYDKSFEEVCDLYFDVVDENQMIVDWNHYKKDGSVYKHFETISKTHQLKGFLAFGDSVCSLNPLYGQGTTAEAECAMWLDFYLREKSIEETSFYSDYQKKLFDIYSFVWIMATLSDLSFEETKGSNWWYRK
ncbi:hypothetical protein ABK040_006585 [Willaertia magna]